MRELGPGPKRSLLQKLNALICRLHGHRWRKARKGESPTLKFCSRCKVTSVVRKRAPKAV